MALTEWHYMDKIKVKISQNFAAFSEYMNFKARIPTSYLPYLPLKIKIVPHLYLFYMFTVEHGSF